MSSLRIVTGMHQIEAEAAAGRLRSTGIAAHVVRDNEALLGVAGSSSLGTFSVVIADSDEQEARRVLRLGSPSARSEVSSDGPFSATVILVGVVVLVAGFVALYSWSIVGR